MYLSSALKYISVKYKAEGTMKYKQAGSASLFKVKESGGGGGSRGKGRHSAVLCSWPD